MNKKPISPGGVRDFGTLRTLIGYLAPHGNREIAVRITLAMIFLITAKMATVYVPVLYKEAVDLLDKPVDGIVVVPVMLIVAYGMVRLASAAFAELRDFVFAKVGQRAIRTVALETFRHLHRLSLRFHLERQTGGLSRAIERGTKGIDFLLTFMLFNILPTLIEIIMVAGVLCVALRHLVRGGHPDDHRRLYRLHPRRHGMADEIPPDHERDRQRGEHQGDRQPAELRDSKVFRQ